MTRERALALLDRFAGTPVLVFGDLMLDRYIWGDATRISPEAPVPVVHAVRESSRLGGAGNVAANIQSLKAQARPVGLVGNDPSGDAVRSLLEGIGADVTGVVVAPNRRTTVKSRIIARNQQVVRVDFETEPELTDPLRDALGQELRRALPGAAAVILSDYGKGLIDAASLEVALSLARAANVPVAVDPKETHFFDYRGVTVITPNTTEAGGALGRRLTTDAAVEAAGHELRRRLDAASVLITRGERGMSLFEPDAVTHLPTVAEEVYDVTGAGDTVVSTFALAHAVGATFAEAAEIANVAASLAVREVGTIAVEHAELRRALEARTS